MIGKTILHYKILAKLGEGGMGVVYKARDTKLDRDVAIKFLPHHIAANAEERERFKIEAKAAAALNHPNITTIYAIEEVDGEMFIVMEFIDGQELRDIVGAKHSQQPTISVGAKHSQQPISSKQHDGARNASPLSVDQIITIATQIAGGLEAAHAKGVVHRDIKSSNIMVTESGQVKVMDFGLAKISGEAQITKADTTLGTLAYMSPEQLRGEAVDHRTDIWSLGVVLYEMHASRLPFISQYEAAIIYSIANEDPIPPAELREDIPEALEHITLKCLRKNREDRYSSAQLLLTDLKKLQKALTSEELRESLTARPEKPQTRKETERRQATIMFARISGFTEMLAKPDPEEAATTMSQCFEAFGATARKYGGTINDIMGNRITLLFGVPEAMENVPQKAVNAAIAMRNELQRFNEERNLLIPLNVQFGINTGMVVFGAIGAEEKIEYTAIGHTVELASQLMELAAKGHIYVGPLTYRHTRQEFEYKEIKPVTLESGKAPVPVFELLSTKEKIHRAARMIESEMIGRDKELDKLELHVHQVINGQGSIVSVIGEAGIGKSRLLAELKKKEAIKKVTLLEGRALSFGRNLSFYPIIDILRNWANIEEDDTETQALQKLERAIARIYPDGVAETFPFIATLMGMRVTGKAAERIKGISGAAMEKLILKTLRELIAKGSEVNPIVYVVEDLHWADLSSIELLESLFRLAEKQRVLFINVFRPNYRETGEQVLAAIKDKFGPLHTEIRLEPLDEKSSEALLHNFIKASDLPTGIRDAIARRAEGNPFFIEEVVRSFIDEGIVSLQNGAFKMAGKIDAAAIPETIQDVIMTRIDRLDETTRSLLKTAAVIGRRFFYKILAEVAKDVGGEIDDRLELLKEAQLIRESRRWEELEYFFKHALVQEAAYESILLKKRKELHLQVACTIENVFAERLHELYAILAYHFSQADEKEKAEEYLLKAGEEALKSAASREALNHYRDALKLYEKKYGEAGHPDTLAMLERNIAMALYNKGEMVEAVDHFDKAGEYLGIKSRRKPAAQVCFLLYDFLDLLFELYFPLKRPKKIPTARDNEIINLFLYRADALISVDSMRLIFIAMEALRRMNRFKLTMLENGLFAYVGGSGLFTYAGISFRLARKILDEVKIHLRDENIKARIRYKLSDLLLDHLSGRWPKELRYDHNLVEACLQVGELWQTGAYILEQGFLHNERGNFGECQKMTNKLLEIAEVFDNQYTVTRKYHLQIELFIKTRKLSQALREIDAGLLFLKEINEYLMASKLTAHKLYVQVLLQNFEEAEIILAELNAIAAKEKVIVPYLTNAAARSRFLFYLAKLEEAIIAGNTAVIPEFQHKTAKYGKQAIKLARRFAPLKTEAFKMMGTYCWLIGRPRRARRWWGKSIRLGEQLGARPDLARTYMEVGKRLSEKTSAMRELNGIDAEEYFEKARALFQDMELSWDLEELERIRHRV